ncbi:hypothetical protein ACFQ0M_48275 [Kitasatospora aburaviensis]|uniref:Uncharacterized protein n=1 Tax=Kitasatospora aburaviensis TaxID=67265 RepID=A0ABW1EYX0_9ACTN
MVVAERLATAERLRRFLVVNRYAVRYAPDRLSLLLLSPVAQRVENGTAQHQETGVVTEDDRRVPHLPMPIPAGRWDMGIWKGWDASLGGFVAAEQVAGMVRWAEEVDKPVALGGEGTVWIGEGTLYHPQSDRPTTERWTPYEVPWEFIDLRREHWEVSQRCAEALLLPVARYRKEMFLDTVGGRLESHQVQDRGSSVWSVRTLMEFPLVQVEANGAGVVRVWGHGGGVVVWTPVMEE